MTITCSDYLKLDQDAQSAVVEEIVSQDESILGPGDVEIAKSLADALCSFLPQSVVSQILLGGIPQ